MDVVISVIVPVFNTKNYLAQCIDSILNQSFKEIEVLLIDDGSTDGSSELCDQYGEKDRRVRVWHRDHSGVSSSRNFALEQARGTWISFVDSDDWLDLLMYQDLIELSKKAEVQIVCCGFWYCNGDSKEISTVWDVLPEEDWFCSGKDAFRTIMERSGTLWNKIFSADIAKSLSFETSIRFGEDMLYLAEYLTHVSKAAITKKPDYFYRYNRAGNLFSSTLNESQIDFINATEKVAMIIIEYCDAYVAVIRCEKTIERVLYLIPLREAFAHNKYIEAARKLAFKIQPYEKNAFRGKHGVKQGAQRALLILIRKSGILAVAYAKCFYLLNRTRSSKKLKT